MNTNEVCGHWDTGYFANSPFQVNYNQPQTVALSLSDGSDSSVTDTSFEYLINSAYLGANIISPVASTQTMDGSTSQVVSQVVFGYDESNGSPQGLYGNQTSVSRLVNSGAPSVTTSIVYNGQGMPTVETDANGNSTVTTYDGSGLFPSKIQLPTTNGVPHIDYYSYDANTGHMNWQTDENGSGGGDPVHTTFYTYADPLGRLTKVLGPSSQYGQAETDITYNDSTHTVTSTVIATPNPTEVSSKIYDGWGRMVQQQMSTGSGTIYSTTALDWAGRTVEAWNPSTCNPVTVSSCPGETTWGITSYVYDALGRKVLQCNPDNLNNLPCQPGNSYKQWSYNGNSTTMKDEVFNSTTRISDALGRLTQVTEPGSLTTTYSYDTLGNLTHVTQAGNGTETPRQRSFKYDSLSRLLWSNNPETGVICYGHGNGTMAGCQADGYDANGNLLYKTDARGQVVSYSYDALNRMVSKSFNGAQVAGYWYDGTFPPGIPGAFFSGPTPNQIGRLDYAWAYTSTAAGKTDQYLAYDVMGRLNNWTWASPSELGWQAHSVYAGYDLAGNMTDLQYPDHSTIAQKFDRTGRLSGVSAGTSASPGASYVSSITYSPDGTLQSISLSPNVTQTITENNRLQPCHYVAKAGSTLLMDRSYIYTQSSSVLDPCTTPQPNNNGNLWQIADNLPNGQYAQELSYDSLNRLKSFLAPNMAGAVRSQSFQYDSFGNMVSPQGYSDAVPSLAGTPSARALANPGNHLSPRLAKGAHNRVLDAVFDCVGGDGSSHYDAAGNMLCNGSNAQLNAQQYAWDPESRMASFSAQHGGNTYDFTTQYSYDALGNRVRSDQFSPGSSTANFWREYTFFQGQMLAEKDQNGNFTDYIYAGGQKIAKVTTTDTHYYLADHLGTAQVELDASGNVTWQGGFAPFGQELDSGQTSMRYKFTGKERDTESGLDYFGARYYGSSMGRFMSPDWSDDPVAIPYSDLSNPQTLNLYAYAGNSPVRNVDDDGHEVWLCVNGQSSCTHFSDDQWDALLQKQADAVKNGTNGGITIDGKGFLGTGTISCGGQECGQAIYNQEGIHDESGDLALGYIGGKVGGMVLGKAFGFIGGLFGRGAEGTAGGAVARAGGAAVDVANLSAKITKQMASRGWTAAEITETVENGTAHAAVNKATGGAATEFVNPANGKFVVVDNATKQVLQVSGPGFHPNYMGKP